MRFLVLLFILSPPFFNSLYGQIDCCCPSEPSPLFDRIFGGPTTDQDSFYLSYDVYIKICRCKAEKVDIYGNIYWTTIFGGDSCYVEEWIDYPFDESDDEIYPEGIVIRTNLKDSAYLLVNYKTGKSSVIQPKKLGRKRGRKFRRNERELEKGQKVNYRKEMRQRRRKWKGKEVSSE